MKKKKFKTILKLTLFLNFREFNYRKGKKNDCTKTIPNSNLHSAYFMLTFT